MHALALGPEQHEQFGGFRTGAINADLGAEDAKRAVAAANEPVRKQSLYPERSCR
jgi:hypothetical protein